MKKKREGRKMITDFERDREERLTISTPPVEEEAVTEEVIEEQTSEPSSYDAIVKSDLGLNVRQGPGKDYAIVEKAGKPFRLVNDTKVSIVCEENGFGQLSSLEGWVSLEYLRK